MAILMGKCKLQEWKEIDRTNPDSDFTEQEQKDYMESEYRLIVGREWMFKWVETESIAAA